MVPLSWMIVLLSALAADLSPEELVGRLGSPDRVIREEAARTLEEQGQEALPTLLTAREVAKEPEARERFATLIARIEARSLDRPTMVQLDREDRPLGAAVATLASQSGFALALDDPALADRRVTARNSAPVPFWEAVDQLGMAGHIRHDPGPRGNGNDSAAATIHLGDGDPPGFTAYAGPCRIHLFATHRHRDLNFQTTRDARIPEGITQVTIEVQAFAEPGRFLNANGVPRLEGIDEQGRVLPPPAAGGDDRPNPSETSWLVPGRISLLHWHIPLGIPDPSVQSPLKLRGVLPVVIAARRPNPLVIPLLGNVGTTFRQDRRFVRIEKISTRDNMTTIDFFLGEDGRPADRIRTSTGPEEDYVGDYLRNRIEFEDAEGHRLGWHIFDNNRASVTNGELRLHTFVSGPTPPARMLIYSLNRLATEIPFEFRNVPRP